MYFHCFEVQKFHKESKMKGRSLKFFKVCVCVYTHTYLERERKEGSS